MPLTPTERAAKHQALKAEDNAIHEELEAIQKEQKAIHTEFEAIFEAIHTEQKAIEPLTKRHNALTKRHNALTKRINAKRSKRDNFIDAMEQDLEQATVKEKSHEVSTLPHGKLVISRSPIHSKAPSLTSSSSASTNTGPSKIPGKSL